MDEAVFGRLTVLRQAPRRGKGLRWICLCECGREHEAAAGNLRSGRVTSCGCYRADRLTTHGHGHKRGIRRETPEYRTWRGMRSRCGRPEDPAYVNYGGRGIVVCERWAKDFAAFLTDMGMRPASGLSLDRIDNNGPYSPENCRWATPTEQGRNQRRTVRVEGRALADVCEERGLSAGMVGRRLRAGVLWPWAALDQRRQENRP
jgi:hypothetical protein